MAPKPHMPGKTPLATSRYVESAKKEEIFTLYHGTRADPDTLRRDGLTLPEFETIMEFRYEAEANARLLAAAPDLLEALEEALEDAERQGLAARPGVEPDWAAAPTLGAGAETPQGGAG